MRDFLRRLGLPDDPGTRLLALKALLAEAEKTGWAVGAVASKKFWPPRPEEDKMAFLLLTLETPGGERVELKAFGSLAAGLERELQEGDFVEAKWEEQEGGRVILEARRLSPRPALDGVVTGLAPGGRAVLLFGGRAAKVSVPRDLAKLLAEEGSVRGRFEVVAAGPLWRVVSWERAKPSESLQERGEVVDA